MTPKQQAKAIALLKKTLKFEDQLGAGGAIDTDVSEKHTTDLRVFLIEVGAIKDRRKS